MQLFCKILNVTRFSGFLQVSLAFSSHGPLGYPPVLPAHLLTKILWISSQSLSLGKCL